MLLNAKVFFKDVILAKKMGILVLVSWGLVKFWKLEGGRRRRCLLEVRYSYGPEYSFQFIAVVSMCACWSVSYFNWDIHTVKGFFFFEVKK